jgi:cytoskeletal protein CcmA (bactofilin family)
MMTLAYRYRGHAMLNLGRNDRWVDLKESNKPGDKPPIKPAGASPGAAATVTPAARPVAPAPASREIVQDTPVARDPSPSPAEVAGSKLFVGINIKLKGVEISNCDVLVIEGQVDATINSKVMEISKPGALTGTAIIDVAEIHGEFSGELTARTKLVVHGTGRVTGTVRYGKLVVAEGGTVTGELRQIDANSPESRPTPTTTATADARAATQTPPAH